MADYVFKADPEFNRVILEDIEGNKVFVNSQLELDFYTEPRPGGSFDGSYWKSIGNAGKIPKPVLQQAEEEYIEKESQGDDLVEFTENLEDLNLNGPDGSSDGSSTSSNNQANIIIPGIGASQTAANVFAEGIPAGGEIVKSKNKYYVLYQIPNTGLSLSYEATEDDIKGLYPLDFDAQSFRTVSEQDISLTVPFGNIAELYDPRFLAQGITPWEGFVDYLDKEAELRPWLEDEEMVFLLAESTLEGRTVTEAEWKTTNWWRTSTQDERDWLLLSQGKPTDELPKDAQIKLADNEILIKNLMIESGINNPSQNLIKWISDKYTTGNWTNTKTEEQIALIADPSKIGTLDDKLQNFITSGDMVVDTTRSGEDKIRSLYQKWWGPVFGNVGDTLIAEKAGLLRNNPDYEIEFEEELKGSRKSLFPNYDENLTYQDIAAPWQSFTNNIWGEQVDPTSEQFQEVLKLNNSVEASKYLTQQGLDLGKSKVVNEALQGLKVFGQGVRIE
tara:strand:- start:954 stop:2462 length:1509 start_codon:yes stop_codon:yes gene_type:complete